MPLFWRRRRSGRHAASRPDLPADRLGADRASPSQQSWSLPSAPGPAQGRAQTERLAPPPTGPLHPYGQVRLGFADGSAVTLAADDPRVRAFRALARELARRG